jgi:hypothetical protein
VIGTSSIDWTQLSKSYLKTETEPSLRNVVLKDKQDNVLDKDKTLDIVQNRNVYTKSVYAYRALCSNCEEAVTFFNGLQLDQRNVLISNCHV